MDMKLRVGAVIPSVDRKDALERAVSALLDQTRPLAQLVVVLPDVEGLPPSSAADDRVDVVIGPRGASCQRNAGVARLDSDVDVVIFLDDDSVPRSDYVDSVHTVMTKHPEVVALTGRMACDGAAERREFSPAEMQAALVASHEVDTPHVQRPSSSLYGCNMAIRREAIAAIPFDEALPLYSWLEDLDVARRLAGIGEVVFDSRCVVAHQGNASGGRTQHIRFGYSSVANPIHLKVKGSLGWSDLARLVGKPAVANLRGLFSADRSWRSQRLRGQAMAVQDFLCRRMSPGRITEL